MMSWPGSELMKLSTGHSSLAVLTIPTQTYAFRWLCVPPARQLTLLCHEPALMTPASPLEPPGPHPWPSWTWCPHRLRQHARCFMLRRRQCPFTGTAGWFVPPDAGAGGDWHRQRTPRAEPSKGVHASAMTLLAETATGMVVGMNVRDDCLPWPRSSWCSSNAAPRATCGPWRSSLPAAPTDADAGQGRGGGPRDRDRCPRARRPSSVNYLGLGAVQDGRHPQPAIRPEAGTNRTNKELLQNRYKTPTSLPPHARPSGARAAAISRTPARRACWSPPSRRHAAGPHAGPWAIEDAIIGCSFPEGEQGMNMARIATGLAFTHPVGGVTVNRFCAPA